MDNPIQKRRWWGLRETTTPTAETGLGKIYTKNDNTLYFQDAGGNEHEIGTVDSHYGEMKMYESTGTQTVGQTNQYYAINGEYGVGEVSGFSFVSGSNGSGNITDVGSLVNINDADHGLLDGDIVNIQCATATQSGTSVVTYVDADNFTLSIPFDNAEACTWQQGDYLLAGSGTAGKYLLDFAITVSSGAAAKNYKFEPVINTTHIDSAAFEITTSGTNHQSSMGSGIVDIAVGDRIWAQFKNETDSQDLNYEHSNIHVTRL